MPHGGARSSPSPRSGGRVAPGRERLWKPQASRPFARRLTLSVRTVDNHLQNAYTKLGITSRAELAESLGAAQPST